MLKVHKGILNRNIYADFTVDLEMLQSHMMLVYLHHKKSGISVSSIFDSRKADDSTFNLLW